MTDGECSVSRGMAWAELGKRPRQLFWLMWNTVCDRSKDRLGHTKDAVLTKSSGDEGLLGRL